MTQTFLQLLDAKIAATRDFVEKNRLKDSKEHLRQAINAFFNSPTDDSLRDVNQALLAAEHTIKNLKPHEPLPSDNRSLLSNQNQGQLSDV